MGLKKSAYNILPIQYFPLFAFAFYDDSVKLAKKIISCDH